MTDKFEINNKTSESACLTDGDNLANLTSDLFIRVQSGDVCAFEKVVRLSARPLFRFLFRMVRNKDQAEDIVQETFLKTYLAIDQYDPKKASSLTWIFRIAHNLAIDYMRKPSTKMFWGKMDSFDENPNLDMPYSEETARDFVMKNELSEVLSQAIDKLPDKFREVFSLVEEQGLTYSEAALVCKCREGTIKSRLFRAKELIRISLAQHLDEL